MNVTLSFQTPSIYFCLWVKFPSLLISHASYWYFFCQAQTVSDWHYLSIDCLDFEPFWICGPPKRFPAEEFKPTDKEH